MCALTVTPNFSDSFLVLFNPSLSISMSSKFEPASANLSAVAFPIPAAAPVIIDVFPFNSISSCRLYIVFTD